jgi:exodeoxyribonuclease-3
MKLISWNVNGIRAAIKKGLWEKLDQINAAVYCFQETKTDHQKMLELFPFGQESDGLLIEDSLVSEDLKEEKKYNFLWHSAENRKGYSGVSTLWHKSGDLNLADQQIGVLNPEFDIEGRFISTKFETKKGSSFVLINCYYPQGGRGPHRIEYKINFYKEVLEYVKKLQSQGENVILCGDFNTTVRDIDLARPKENRKITGCLPEERDALNWFFEAGFIDSFRHFYPDLEDKYSYWDQITRARERNVGWRIDYFLVDKKLVPNLKSADIFDQVMGSDHAPVSIELDI